MMKSFDNVQKPFLVWAVHLLHSPMSASKHFEQTFAPHAEQVYAGLAIPPHEEQTPVTSMLSIPLVVVFEHQ